MDPGCCSLVARARAGNGDLVPPVLMAYGRQGPPLMRSFLACVLAALLTVTTPVGTGQGVHQSDLLHPVLPHLHFVDGHLVSGQDSAPPRVASVADTRAEAPTQQSNGPALGSGAGADAASLGMAISPTLPKYALLLLPSHLGRLDPSRVSPPSEFLDTPDDPPPQPPASEPLPKSRAH